MSVPFSRQEQQGHSSWSLEDLQAHQSKIKSMNISGTHNPAMRALEGRAEVEVKDDGDDEDFGGAEADELMEGVEVGES